MCSSNNYINLVDFDWYIDILIQLIRTAPIPSSSYTSQELEPGSKGFLEFDVSERIGDELRSVAVKVKAIRLQATRAAESILISTYNDSSSQLSAGSGVLRPVVWIVGEFTSYLSSPDGSLTALLQLAKSSTAPEALIVYLQALPKIFSSISGEGQIGWSPERKTMVSLLMARIIHALEPLAMHPDLEAPERAVEFSELPKLAAEASSALEPESDNAQQHAPLLLTQAIPSLFAGWELNSVAIGAQRNVPMPSDLDLDQPINPNLTNLLRAVEFASFEEPDDDEFEVYYHQKPPPAPQVEQPAATKLGAVEESVHSYQHGGEESYLDPDIVARRRAERLERNKDDPFYIAPTDETSDKSTSLRTGFPGNNLPDLDIDAIPIMQLDLSKTSLNTSGSQVPRKPLVPKAHQRVQVEADETLAISGSSTPRNYDSENSLDSLQRPRQKGKQSLLQIDSSNLAALSLAGDNPVGPLDFERQKREEAEMAKAIQEVERLRLEMQRANERIKPAQGVEGTVVKKKKKKSKHVEPVETGNAVTTVKRKKKAKKPVPEDGPQETLPEVVKPKKKKKAKPEEESQAKQGAFNLGA